MGFDHVEPAPDGFGCEIYEGLDHIDMFTIYREVRCPLLLFNAATPDDGGRSTAAGPAWTAELTSAFRRGQTRDLIALAAVQPNVRLETVTGTHGLLFEQSQAIAHLVLAFLAS